MEESIPTHTFMNVESVAVGGPMYSQVSEMFHYKENHRSAWLSPPCHKVASLVACTPPPCTHPY